MQYKRYAQQIEGKFLYRFRIKIYLEFRSQVIFSEVIVVDYKSKIIEFIENISDNGKLEYIYTFLTLMKEKWGF